MQELVIHGVPKKQEKWYGLSVIKYVPSKDDLEKETEEKKIKCKLAPLRKKIHKMEKKMDIYSKKYISIKNEITRLEKLLIDMGCHL